MKVKQLRAVLGAASQLHGHSGNSELAQIFARLSAAMKDADKDDVCDFFERLAVFRRSNQGR